MTPLQIAVWEGNRQIVDLLLSRGADINKKNEDNTPGEGLHNAQTPLLQALYRHYDEIAVMLIDREADINVEEPDGHAAFSLALANNCQNAVRRLIGRGIEVHRKLKFEVPSLFYIMTSSEISLEKEDFQSGKEYVLIESPPLAIAAWNDSIGSMKALLDNGVKIDACDSDGRTALHYAAWKDQSEAVELLLSKGAQVNRQSKNGWTALHYAVSNISPSKESFVTVNLLIEKGADINRPAKSGNTPLALAREGKNNGVIRILEQAGAK